MNNYPVKKVYNPNSPTSRWSAELESDELAGMKRVMLKLETHKAIQELTTQRSGATYDDIILAALGALKREEDTKDLEFEEEET